MSEFVHNVHLKRSAKEDQDYLIVSHQVWEALTELYSYSYDLPRISVQVPTEDPDKCDFIVEAHMRRFEVCSSPNIKYIEKLKMPHRVYVSRSSTVREMHLKICEAIQNKSAEFKASELLELSRLWVFEQQDNLQDLEYQLS